MSTLLITLLIASLIGLLIFIVIVKTVPANYQWIALLIFGVLAVVYLIGLLPSTGYSLLK